MSMNSTWPMVSVVVTPGSSIGGVKSRLSVTEGRCTFGPAKRCMLSQGSMGQTLAGVNKGKAIADSRAVAVGTNRFLCGFDAVGKPGSAPSPAHRNGSAGNYPLPNHLRKILLNHCDA